MERVGQGSQVERAGQDSLEVTDTLEGVRDSQWVEV